MTTLKSWVVILLVLLVGIAAKGCSALKNKDFSSLCVDLSCADWETVRFTYNGIPIAGFRKPGSYEDRMVVYIEGDGIAWRNRYRVSRNPTPTDPIGLKLAMQDPRLGVFYLARPCQFVRLKSFDRCNPALWSTARYSEEVVEAMSYAVSELKRLESDKVELVGYSGGGVVAALLAARRADVDVLVTVASPLDTDAWTKHHGVSPLSESINPSSVLTWKEKTCRVHFYGKQDKVVPDSVVEPSLCSRVQQNAACFSILDYDHRCCWVRDWPELLAATRFCRNPDS